MSVSIEIDTYIRRSFGDVPGVSSSNCSLSAISRPGGNPGSRAGCVPSTHYVGVSGVDEVAVIGTHGVRATGINNA